MLSTASASRLSKGRCCLSSDCSCEVMEDNVDVITRIVNGARKTRRWRKTRHPTVPSAPRVFRVLASFASFAPSLWHQRGRRPHLIVLGRLGAQEVAHEIIPAPPHHVGLVAKAVGPVGQKQQIEILVGL